jgi:class 3 adenylate cyclase
VAAFLGRPEGEVAQLLEEGRLGGVLLAGLRLRGLPVTPSLKNSVQTLVRTLEPERDAASGQRLHHGASMHSDGTSTIMFTDVVGSSALMQRLGDRAGRLLLKRSEEIISRETEAHNGLEVKSMGDGFMLSFRSAGRAVACASAVQRAIADHNLQQTQDPILVRIGVCVGEPIQDEDDMFGLSVIMAARITALARGGQVLLCPVSYALVSSSGDFDFRPLGPVELKGIEGSHHLYEVVWRTSIGA